MKKNYIFLFVLLFAVMSASLASALSLDLNQFNYDNGVSISWDGATFEEDPSLAAVYLYNDTFLVAIDASILSFDYSFTLGSYDPGDHFAFELNYINLLSVFNSSSGNFSIDLTAYRGSEISLAWGLIWGGDPDDVMESAATLSKIDLTIETIPSTPVPEPSTMSLLGFGLIGLIGIGLKKTLLK